MNRDTNAAVAAIVGVILATGLWMVAKQYCEVKVNGIAIVVDGKDVMFRIVGEDMITGRACGGKVPGTSRDGMIYHFEYSLSMNANHPFRVYVTTISDGEELATSVVSSDGRTYIPAKPSAPSVEMRFQNTYVSTDDFL